MEVFTGHRPQVLIPFSLKENGPGLSANVPHSQIRVSAKAPTLSESGHADLCYVLQAESGNRFRPRHEMLS